LNIVFSTLTVEIEGNNKDLIDSEIKKIINQTDSSCTISLKEKE